MRSRSYRDQREPAPLTLPFAALCGQTPLQCKELPGDLGIAAGESVPRWFPCAHIGVYGVLKAATR